MSEEVKKPAGKKKFELDPKLAEYRGIWVFIEHERGTPHTVSWELLGEARKLADKLGVQVAGVVMGAPGEDTRKFCQEAFYHGADHCYLIEDPLLKDYRNQPFTKAMTDLVNAYKPEILLLGATTLGRDLAGSVATTLHDRTDGGLHRAQYRRRYPQPAGDAADLRRQPAVHHPDAQLSSADGHRAPARDGDAEARHHAQRQHHRSTSCR